jgi:hypothetical protein
MVPIAVNSAALLLSAGCTLDPRGRSEELL